MPCCDGLRGRVAVAARTIGGGLRGLSSAALGSEPPGSATLAERALQCFGTLGRKAPCSRLGMGLVCRACGCLAMAKIRVASQACPLGRWGRVSSQFPEAGRRSASNRVTMRPPGG